MCVEVESGNDRDLGTDEGAGARQQVALDVVHRLGHGGAVQCQQHCVDRHNRLESRQKMAAERLVTLGGEWPAGARRGEQQGYGLRSPLGQHLQHPAHHTPGDLQNVVAVAEFESLEGGDVDRLPAEVVALGQDPADRHAW